GTCGPHKDAWWWQIQGGIAKNFTGYGDSIFYGEYGRHHNFGAEVGGRDFVSTTSPVTNGFAALTNVTKTDATVWGFGFVQNFSAAATEWYIGFRQTSVDFNNDVGCFKPGPNAASPHSAGDSSASAPGSPILTGKFFSGSACG